MYTRLYRKRLYRSCDDIIDARVRVCSWGAARAQI
jgi:hypothetical protein